VQGEEITAVPVEAPKAQIIDLMEALKASLAAQAPAAAGNQPIPLAGRKPAKRSERAAPEPVPAVLEAPKRKGSKR
jgi:non-homologous end joining protein Ku